MLLINGSNREKNNYQILKDIKKEKDELLSLSHKNIKYCLGCDKCREILEEYCIQKDDMKQIYQGLKGHDKIILSSPLYMSHITGLLKNMIDRCNPFYHHDYFNGKTIYLILTGQTTRQENEEEIEAVVRYFEGISEWLNFNFKFLDYFTTGDPSKIDDVTRDTEYKDKINKIISTIHD